MDEYLVANREAFPNADKEVFIYEKRTLLILQLDEIEDAMVEIRPKGRKVPPRSDLKQRRRRKRNLRDDSSDFWRRALTH